MISSPFICVGITSQILGPRYLTLSEPGLTISTFGTSKYVQFLRLYWFWCLIVNISFMILSEIPWYILYISVARVLRFLPWMETELSISRNSSKEDFLSLHIKRGHISWSLLFFFSCDYDTSKLTGNNYVENRKTHVIILASYLNPYTVLS